MWNELGITETHDVILIRRAYAARLRQVRSDTAAFQKLRAAYEKALAFAAGPTPRIKTETVAAKGETLSPIEPPPPDPPPPDPAAPLLRKIDLALKASDFPTALALYDHALAQGLFPLGMPDMIERIMQAALDDRAITPDDYLALVKRVGWNMLPVRSDPALQLRQEVIERAEAEQWFLDQERIARQRVSISFAGLWSAKARLKNVQAHAARRNACLLTVNKDRWLTRISPRVMNDLRGRLGEYQHRARWVGHRFDPKLIARAERMVKFDDRWGNRLRKSWHYLAAIIWFALVLAMVAYGPSAWAALMIFTLGYLIALRRRRAK